jgi:hypothetical protein
MQVVETKRKNGEWDLRDRGTQNTDAYMHNRLWGCVSIHVPSVPPVSIYIYNLLILFIYIEEKSRDLCRDLIGTVISVPSRRPKRLHPAAKGA